MVYDGTVHTGQDPMAQVISYAHILACYFIATPQEITEGRQWYRRAQIAAGQIAEETGFQPEVIAGVIAALSPNNRWERNLRDARNLARVVRLEGDPDDVKVSTFNRNKQRAIDILWAGDNHPSEDGVERLLGGNKVRAFFHCIHNGGVTDRVCVDGHAYAIWLGERIPTTRTPSLGDKLYAAIANDYAQAAAAINGITEQQLTAAEVQAVTWVAWRNRFGGVKS